jgi:F-type H+-transporting ATPase subunit b
MRTAILCACIVALAGPALASEEASGGLLEELGYPFLNLLLLFAALVYFARKPIRDYFAGRRRKVQDDLHSAAELRREAELRYAKWQRKLIDLTEELEQIRAASRERAEAERENIIADANATAERIQSDALAAIDQELRRSRDLLRDEAADLAIGLAENLLRDRVTAEDRERLVNEFVERIESAGAPTGAGSGR